MLSNYLERVSVISNLLDKGNVIIGYSLSGRKIEQALANAMFREKDKATVGMFKVGFIEVNYLIIETNCAKSYRKYFLSGIYLKATEKHRSELNEKYNRQIVKWADKKEVLL